MRRQDDENEVAVAAMAAAANYVFFVSATVKLLRLSFSHSPTHGFSQCDFLILVAEIRRCRCPVKSRKNLKLL